VTDRAEKTVLFLCTGNYYRSRYAEILFSWQARQHRLAWRAVSRGLDPDPRNPGPMSRDTIAALATLGIPVEDHLRFPLSATDADFERADTIVAVKEAEHRPLIERKFPRWLERVEFWHVHDLDCCGPEEAILELDRQVAALVHRLAGFVVERRGDSSGR
jgi:low molecular weight protein-tyrosine phosphatase